MDTAGRVLDVLFRQVSPEQVLHSLEERISGDLASFFRGKGDFEREKEKLFMDFAESALNGYSENEQRILYRQIKEKTDRREAPAAIAGGLLSLLIQYGIETLAIVGGSPCCKPEKTLSWRDTYLRIGQDIVICPFLAYQDYCNGITRSDFTWPAIIRVNDPELYRILGRGMAENHSHINGSTQSFPITWCRIMNYPEKIRTELKHFKGSDLRARMSRGTGDNRLDMFSRLELAALIRSILFRAIHRDKFYNSYPASSPCNSANGASDRSNARKPFNGETAFFDEYISTFSFKNNLYRLVDALRSGVGAQLDYPGGTAFCLDYVLDNTLMQHCIDSHVRVLVGERYFLYQCTLQSMRSDGFNSFEQGLFYLYLLLKCNFRSEMIQANDQTGFKNFQNYQDRKDDAWDENPYFWEAVRMALNYRLTAESIVSLEGRLVPKSSSEKNIEKIYRFDLAKRFADCTSVEAIDPSSYGFDVELDIDQFVHLPYFFVYHFIKKPDNRESETAAFGELPCRHQAHRMEQRKAAVGLAGALRKSAYLRNRVRGIDTSANEVGCRPEVFAPLYRYIDGVQQKWNSQLDTLLPSSPMRISKAYHVGEDFLDIADGLRAIDEAVEFLNMGPGSRIGHALAMGVAPEDHYRQKKYEIVTTKQDRLDDLVWILYRMKELGVQIDGELEARLQKEAYQHFREIYGKAIEKNNWTCGLNEYYCSMKLRGDDPAAYYPDKRINVYLNTSDEFDNYLIDNTRPLLDSYRNEQCIVGLYYYYHYGVAEGVCGQKTVTCQVDEAYMKLMRQAQDAMQKNIERKRIIVECNLSSNVLIGTFQRYDHHPVFRFNRRKLEPHKDIERAQLHVCVNTDDLGVFDTSLEFEYALISQTLLAQRDGKAQPKYNARDVMEYLNDLREMGITAIFPENIGSS